MFEEQDLLDSLFPEEMMPLEIGHVLQKLVETGYYDAGRRRWTIKGEDDSAPNANNQSERVCRLLNMMHENIHAIHATEPSTKSQSLPWLDQIRWTTRYSGTKFPPQNGDGGLFLKPNVVFPACSSLQQSMFSVYQTPDTTEEVNLKNGLVHFHRLAHQLLTDVSYTPRRFVAGMFVNSKITKFTLVLEDCSGLVISDEYSMHNEPRALLRVLIGVMLGQCRPEILGYDSAFFEQLFLPSTCARVQGEVYHLVKNIFCTEDASGRRTMVWLVKKKDSAFVLKDCWVEEPEGELTEVEMMKYTSSVEGITKLVAYDVGQVYDYAKGCNVDETSGRFRVGAAKELWDERKHYRFILTPYGQPLTSFRDLKELLSGVIDAVAAHEALWVKKNVLHRDISVSNIVLYDPSAQDNGGIECGDNPSVTRRGLLIDLDMAVISDQRYELKGDGDFCVGTDIFIARDVLFNDKESTHHRPWHELESFFYVIFYICLKYSGPESQTRCGSRLRDKFPNYYLGDEPEDLERLALEKDRMFATEKGFRDIVVPHVDEYFKPLVEMMVRLREAIFGASGDVNRRRVTHAEMLSILRNTLCDLNRTSESTREIRKAHDGPQKRKRLDEVQPDNNKQKKPSLVTSIN